MNTAQQNQNLILDTETAKALQSMAKAVNKDSIRNYAQVIGYRNGYFAVTDGYALLAYESAAAIGEGTLNPFAAFAPASVKYPKFDGVIPNAEGRPIDTAQLLKIANCIKATAPRAVVCYLTIDSQGKTTFGDGNHERTNINPWILNRFIKAIPKEYHEQLVAHVVLEGGDGVLVLKAGPFKLILCSAYLEKEQPNGN